MSANVPAPISTLNPSTDVEDLDFAPVTVGGFYLKAKGASAEITVARPSNRRVDESDIFDGSLPTGSKYRPAHAGEKGTSYTTMDIILRGETTPRPMHLSTYHWALINQEIKAQVTKLTSKPAPAGVLQLYWFEVTKTDQGYSVTVTEPVSA